MAQLIVFRMVQGLGRRLADDPRHDDHRRAVRARAAGANAGLHLGRVGPRLARAAPGRAACSPTTSRGAGSSTSTCPFGAVAMALIAAALTRHAAAGRRPVVDYAGLALFAAGVSALLLGIVEAGRVGAWSRHRRRALLARAAGRRARGVRRGRAARGGADRPAAPVQEPHGPRGRRHRVPRRHGDVRRASRSCRCSCSR